jgi:hypothetical protein
VPSRLTRVVELRAIRSAARRRGRGDGARRGGRPGRPEAAGCKVGAGKSAAVPRVTVRVDGRRRATPAETPPGGEGHWRRGEQGRRRPLDAVDRRRSRGAGFRRVPARRRGRVSSGAAAGPTRVPRGREQAAGGTVPVLGRQMRALGALARRCVTEPRSVLHEDGRREHGRGAADETPPGSGSPTWSSAFLACGVRDGRSASTRCRSERPLPRAAAAPAARTHPGRAGGRGPGRRGRRTAGTRRPRRPRSTCGTA